MDVFKFRKFISGSLVFWFFGSLVHLGFTKLPLKKKNLFWLVGAVKYYFANLSINECSISKRYITLHINGWQQPVESVRDLGGRLVVGWSGKSNGPTPTRGCYSQLFQSLSWGEV